MYGFPTDRAAGVALREVLGYLAEHELPETVTLVCFDDRTLRAYRDAVDAMAG